MWATISRIILRNRIIILILLGLCTGFMAYQSQFVRMQYTLPKLLPITDSTLIAHEEFLERFEGEGSIYVIGIQENPLNDLKLFNAWYRLGKELAEIQGVDTTISVTSIFNLVKNSEEKKFELIPVTTCTLQTEVELDSIRKAIYALPFYKGLLYNDSTGATLMAISLNSKVFGSDSRMALVDKVCNIVMEFSENQKIKVHYSGLPFIRSTITRMVQSELKKFIMLALIITVIILFLFFRSIRPVAVSMLVVAIGVFWALGSIALFDFEITILTGIIPPLIIVIGVPNCIYLINKYHHQYKIHGNQAKALSRVIQKVGNATFMTNATTAMGFVPFIFIRTATLKEFGIIASINIMVLFFVSLIIIPIIFSFLPPPKDRHTKHLDNKWVLQMVETLVRIVKNRRRAVYIVTITLVIAAGFGIIKMHTTGNIVDDLAEDHQVTKDLNFFENNFNGVMPFEISIDAKKPGLATKAHTLKKIDKFQKLLAEYSQFSKPISIAEGVKFTKQAFYNGNPEKYSLINNQEKAFFKPYLEHADDNQQWLNPFIDSTKQFTRVSVQVADIGTKQMDVLLRELKPRIDSIFKPDKYNVDLTGASIVFLKGTTYLIKNLFSSLGIAILLIALIMALLFSSFRMILVSLVTNLFPLILTASLMGYFNIAIKPSTILVFSIAFGISVDDTIHFLAKYRQELKTHDWNIGPSVTAALRETGVSMIYTSVILFFGFTVFSSSEFGGTMAMGILVSFSLLVAMLANLVLLPSFLFSLEKSITTKAFKEPLLQILDEEEDIELDDLTIRIIEREDDVEKDEAATSAEQNSNGEQKKNQLIPK